MVVALEILVMQSARNNGIASGVPGDHYLWTYGPTAFLTAVAALFSRVEYQSKILAPWQRISKQPAAASKSLLLDYVSQFQPFTIYSSLRNKDFVVSAGAMVSVLLKIMIILSTGLITLSLTAVSESEIPMVLQNSFVDDDTMLRSAGTLPRYFMLGLLNDTVDYPPGISKDFAFQTVETSLPTTAQIQVTLDGLTNSLACEPADLVLNEARQAGFYNRIGSTNLTITAPSCNITEAEVFGPNDADEDELPYSPLFGQFSQVQCDGATDDAGKRVLVWFGQMEWFIDETINSTCRRRCAGSRTRGRLLDSAQLLCSPTYDISKVDLIKNGTEMQTVSLSRSSDAQNRTLDHVTPWSIMRAHYESFGSDDGTSTDRESFELGNETIDVDPYTRILLASQLPAGTTNASSLYELSLLERMAQSYYRQFGAIIAGQALLQTEPISTSGSALVMRNRLMVRSWSGQWMAGLAAACLLLTAMMILMAPKRGILPRSPSALSGVAALVSHSPELLVKLRGAGDADAKSLSRSLKSSAFQSSIVHNTGLGQPRFAIQDTADMDVEKDVQPFQQSRSPHSHPGLLHPWTRLALCVVLFAVVAALEVTLHESRNKDGLGDVGDDRYIHYLWTSMPALLLEGIVLMISSMDFNIRSLAPYIILNNVVTTDVFMDLELLDMCTPWAIYKEARLRSLGAIATTTTLLVASFFTIFSSSLFQATSLPQTSAIGLEMQNFLANDSLDNHDFSQSGTTSSLILEGNLSYPSFTYEDLVFPQLLPVPLNPENSISDSTSLSTKTQIPALRARLTCRIYESSSISTNLTLIDPYSDIYHNPLGITVEGETCGLAPEAEFAKYNVHMDTRSNASYFGIGSDLNAAVKSCSDYFYTWGRLDYSAKPPVQHIAALGCNETLEAVDVDVEFAGAELAIDPQRPPEPLEDTARPSAVSANGSAYLYYHIPSLASKQMFSNSFALLTTSRFAVPPSALGDPSRDADAAAALSFQHGVLAAQALHANRAPPARVSAVDAVLAAAGGMVAPGRDSGAGYTYRATATDAAGRRRVVQDAASTRVLEALLLAAAALLLLGWATLPRANVLPDRSPTTVAGAVALLAGGNLVERMPEDAEWRSNKDVRDALGRGTKLWLGWGLMPDEEGIAMGNENENGVSRFGIFVVPPDEEMA
ncbi:hypothetical protein UCDDA912_g02999 [Diaporthe ampelina]|uniref:Uncharacterized protein n=1 Tax=Diaporthe ampelina TaxID=1214573 RepID=A0A0G2FSR3_9PEZI|nr:hypothetical protein UCDDA912_g02999 [Diaporthe ampelina]